MKELRFEWDERKANTNLIKHGISFEEAKTVFFDESALIIVDPACFEEDRFLILGFSADAKLLVVCHCYRSGEEVIRIISARKATRNESNYYKK